MATPPITLSRAFKHVSILIPGGLHTCLQSYTGEGGGVIGGAANTQGALRHIFTLKPERVLAALPIPLGLHMCFYFHAPGGLVVLLVAFRLLYVIFVAYSNPTRSDHIPLTNEYNCERKKFRHPPVDASSLKRLMFRSAIIGARIRLVALTGAIP